MVAVGLMVSLLNDASALGEARSLSGVWTASALSEVWKFGAWPAACGPKPSSKPSPAGTSLVNEEAGELTFTGLGREFRTNHCWEQYPGLRRVAHTRSAEAWSSTCKSADGDPRQANVHTQLTAFGDTSLKFRETGSYEFHIDGAKCSAQVTRARTFSRSVQQVNDALAGDPPAAVGASVEAEAAGPSVTAEAVRAAAGAAPDGKPLPSRGAERAVRSDCEPSGSAQEIRMPRPVNWLQPGASYRLTPALVDAAGCVVAKGPFTYAVEPETEAVHVGLKSGLIRVAPQAPEGKYTVVIRSGQLREVIEVPVVTREGLAAFLQAPTAAPLATDASGPSAPEILGASPAAAVDNATPRKRWFTGLAGLVILGLGGLGLRLLRAGSRPTMPPPPPGHRAPAEGNGSGGASSSSATPRAAVASGQLALTVVPPAATPARAAEGTRAAAPSQTRSNPPPKPRVETTSGEGRACPQCGTWYTDGSVFCGVDGAKLPEPTEKRS